MAQPVHDNGGYTDNSNGLTHGHGSDGYLKSSNDFTRGHENNGHLGDSNGFAHGREKDVVPSESDGKGSSAPAYQEGYDNQTGDVYDPYGGKKIGMVRVCIILPSIQDVSHPQ
jgi:hypothetical protein